jgi:pimeloyl-ACP methyl ester carboxylesterase
MPKPSSPSRQSTTSSATPDVDPRWLLKAAGAAIAFALACALALFWTTFYYTQWQYVLSPSRSISTDPTAVGLAFNEVHFGVDATGQPQLDGWWMPADAPSSPTVLLLHDGKGSMSDALPQARILHNANLNVLLFDYRGFGHSGYNHPTQALMQADAESALAFLRDTRHTDLRHILVYGNGLGASVAVNLCAGHNSIPAVILDAPLGDTEAQVRRDTRTKLIAVHWLFHEQFPLAAPLQTLHTPKLILTYEDSPTLLHRQTIADPKVTVEMNSANDTTAVHDAISRFLDSYVSNR